mgnify:CR=1 FL=1
MNEMIKAERNKISSKKQTKILFAIGAILIIKVCFMTMMQGKCRGQEVLLRLNGVKK